MTDHDDQSCNEVIIRKLFDELRSTQLDTEQVQLANTQR